MWDKNQIADFVLHHPISTDGAINPYVFEVTDGSDGDEWQEVTLPCWMNDSVMICILGFALDAVKLDRRSTNVWARDDSIIVRFYTHACDPD